MPPKKRVKAAKIAWEEVVKEARSHRDKTIQEAVGESLKFPLLDGLNVTSTVATALDEEDAKITELEFLQLLSQLKSGGLSSRRVVEAYLQRAALAQHLVRPVFKPIGTPTYSDKIPQTNCITELLPSQALAKGEELDRYLASHGKPKGPLHGLPISIKSHIGLKGHHMPAGYIAWWDNLSPRDALVVQILERAGAIVFARTTEPQSMMQLECNSNLYGATVNPFNTSLSSGGSSGGEAALIALGGSMLGVGSDVGGSIRVPAAACGIFGLKPTGFRVPTMGWSSTPPGADPVPTVLGPMSQSIEGIGLFMKTILDAEPWREEPSLVPIPWREVRVCPSAESPLRLGVIWHDEVVLPHPPIQRALRDLISELRALPNVHVVDFKPYKHDEAWAIVSSLYFTDGGEADAKAIAESGEPWCPLTEWIIKQNSCVKKLSREELEYWLEEREEYRIEYNDAWNKSGTWNQELERFEGCVDALICPVGPGVATRHGTAKYWYYTSVWNLLDWPAVVFPIGSADKEVDVKNERKRFMSGLDRENWGLCKISDSITEFDDVADFRCR
jgi:amidase